MQYIIMCGGQYDEFETPKQLLKINGETLVERTIRLLKENGENDIAISTTNPAFDYINVPKLKHNNHYVHDKIVGKPEGCWLNAYYPTTESCCYLHGDVYFSEEAIQNIVMQCNIGNLDNNGIDSIFLCTCDWSDKNYIKSPKSLKGREPFGYIVYNQEKFRYAINELLKMVDNGEYDNGIKPFSWHLYRYLNGLDLCKNAKKFTETNDIFKQRGNYMVINDETTDVDNYKDLEALEKRIKEWS